MATYDETASGGGLVAGEAVESFVYSNIDGLGGGVLNKGAFGVKVIHIPAHNGGMEVGGEAPYNIVRNQIALRVEP